MTVIVAMGHILGAIIAVVAFGAGVLALAAWEAERNRRAAAEEISIALGIPVESLETDEHAHKVVQFSAARFSSELLRNRLSDLCGWVQRAWGWLGSLLQIGLLLGVIWYSFADGPEIAVHAWWIVAVAFFSSGSPLWLLGLFASSLQGVFLGKLGRPESHWLSTSGLSIHRRPMMTSESLVA